jgi:hypothetical protein
MKKLRQRKVIKPVLDDKIEKTKLNAPRTPIRKMKQKRI